MIVDVVEWYQPSHLPGGWLGPLHWNVESTICYFYPQTGNVIAISKYLENYFNNRGCHTVRIPPTLDVKNIEPNLSIKDEPLRLVYAGYPGKKDLLKNIIDAVIKFDTSGKRVRLFIAGPTTAEVLQYSSLISYKNNQLPDSVRVLGPLAHEKVIDLIKNADFVPLLRPQLRYAQAGFPTKVPESLSLGTPIICNLTSDLGDFIRDKSEGIICRDYSIDAFVEALESALTLSPTNRKNMRKAARAEAEKSFDYRKYSVPLNTFLEKIAN